ncbi:uncharacterized protein LOC122064124, partial [Macadamia integrifolia]|uniref:uncharacterized protein LOC122064124 n=1 Tax=Macadamia integrifolia TaxID=60698 RepID=UPI001C4F35C1
TIHQSRLRHRHRRNTYLRHRPSPLRCHPRPRHRLSQPPSPCRYPRHGPSSHLQRPWFLRPPHAPTSLPRTPHRPHHLHPNDVTIDHAGNAYVTNSIGNFIWKVNVAGEPSILSRDKVLTSQYIYPDTPYAAFGLNGIAYVSEGYLLVGQCNTGKLFKVDAVNGTASVVKIEKDLMGGNDGIAVRSDGAVVVVSQKTAWLLKSKDGWGEAEVYDEIGLDEERYPTTVTVREDDRAYVVYGRLDKGIAGNMDVEEFSIEEIEWPSVNNEGTVWVYVLVGFALAYFLFWRFHMKNMNKKTT